ncbi:transcriptional repressor [Clostridium fermenticellae]|uniref:Transcriptional repressor n=1 Tax=Clostridium fermenticellae TaxID=2068654 RepID=A0A386H571_9CLOT|nr:Fur family transcriptional regulator [Clostridium fermenticellae]AYD40862.1 transcriptional repressor [Clostridium fermenticellae]
MIPKEIQEKIKFIIQENGLKLTNQRNAVLNAFFEKNYKHMNVEEVYNFSKAYCNEIGISTVYRSIIAFEKIGVLKKIETGEIYARYELTIPDKKLDHPHMVCKKCGRIIGAYDSEILEKLNAGRELIENKYDFKIDSESIVYYGICKECADS